MSKVSRFEVFVDNPERAMNFYGAVFGWKFEKWTGLNDYWMIMAGPQNEFGINGGLSRRPKAGAPAEGPTNAYLCTINVQNLDHTMNLILSNGGSVLKERTAIRGIGWMAYFYDSEGNTFGIMQNDNAAS
ncbi:MAG: VOC family protein [Candidatus Obscuribacterales bacterium]|jgi:predicted enzyme related to lactoylglutathione lyase|nr:VOC family protein [Candidatus Obscuribacterales bacterium]